MYAADRVHKEESVKRRGTEDAMYLGEVDNDDGCKSYQLQVLVVPVY